MTTAVWLVLFVYRVQAHQADVDSYLYADTAHYLLVSQDPASAFLHTGSTSPLVPALAAPATTLAGVYGAMTVELPFLLLLVAGSFFLSRFWISPMAATVAAMAVGLNEAVSGYATTLNFAVPIAAALVWAFYSYIRSGHLREWRWSLLFGLAIAVMLLTRSMSIVYLVPLGLVVGGDLVVDVVRHGEVLRLPAVAAGATVLVLAGPWWLISGHAAIHYLHSAGYQSSSGFTSRGFTLDASTIEQRASWTLSELGWGQSWALGIALLAALWGLVLHRRSLRVTALWMLALWVLLTSIILSSSGNRGTGFGLPVVVVLILLAAAVLGQMSWRALPVLGVALAGILLVGLVDEAAGGDPWWPAAPYRNAVVASGGNSRTNTDLIADQASHLIGSSPTLVSLVTNILNVNGLNWNGRGKLAPLLVPPPTPDGTQVAIKDLARVNMVITGSSPGAYYPSIHQGAVEAAAFREGFGIVRVWTIGHGGGNIVLLRRGATNRANIVPAPVTRLVSPRNGSDVHGKVDIIAGSSDRLFPTTGVSFTVRGITRTVTIPAGLSAFVWLGVWDTTTVPDGTYTIQSVADAGGSIGRSRLFTVHVDN